jgi:NAD(P) transhydrogenase subunit alpha
LELGILKESVAGETRVALLPESLKGLVAQGLTVIVESGAGVAAGASDAAYTDAGATITDRSAILAGADILPVVNAPEPADQARLKPGAVVIGFLKPLDAPLALSTAWSWFPASAEPKPWTRCRRWRPSRDTRP